VGYLSQFLYPSTNPAGDPLMLKAYHPAILASRDPLNPFDFACAATEVRKAKEIQNDRGM